MTHTAQRAYIGPNRQKAIQAALRERELDGWLERTGDTFGTTDDYLKLIELETGLVHDRAALNRQ